MSEVPHHCPSSNTTSHEDDKKPDAPRHSTRDDFSPQSSARRGLRLPAPPTLVVLQDTAASLTACEPRSRSAAPNSCDTKTTSSSSRSSRASSDTTQPQLTRDLLQLEGVPTVEPSHRKLERLMSYRGVGASLGGKARAPRSKKLGHAPQTKSVPNLLPTARPAQAAAPPPLPESSVPSRGGPQDPDLSGGHHRDHAADAHDARTTSASPPSPPPLPSSAQHGPTPELSVVPQQAPLPDVARRSGESGESPAPPACGTHAAPPDRASCASFASSASSVSVPRHSHQKTHSGSNLSGSNRTLLKMASNRSVLSSSGEMGVGNHATDRHGETAGGPHTDGTTALPRAVPSASPSGGEDPSAAHVTLTPDDPEPDYLQDEELAEFERQMAVAAAKKADSSSRPPLPHSSRPSGGSSTNSKGSTGLFKRLLGALSPSKRTTS